MFEISRLKDLPVGTEFRFSEGTYGRVVEQRGASTFVEIGSVKGGIPYSALLEVRPTPKKALPLGL